MFQIRIVLLVSRDFLKAFVCTHPKDKGRLALLADRPSSFGFVHTKALRKSLLTSNSIFLYSTAIFPLNMSTCKAIILDYCPK